MSSRPVMAGGITSIILAIIAATYQVTQEYYRSTGDFAHDPVTTFTVSTTPYAILAPPLVLIGLVLFAGGYIFFNTPHQPNEGTEENKVLKNRAILLLVVIFVVGTIWYLSLFYF